MARSRNEKLAQVIAQAGWSHAQVAAAVVRVATENGISACTAVGRSHVTYWVGGTVPSGDAPLVLREALSRRLGRHLTLDEIGLADLSVTAVGALDWRSDALVTLTELGRVEVDEERRRLLSRSAYSLAALALPSPSQPEPAARRVTPAGGSRALTVGAAEVEAVRDMVRFFSQIDQKRGGGHGRTAVVAYLRNEALGYLNGSFTDDHVRRAMFSAAGELVYLAAWMAFDNDEHAVAQPYFTTAVKLAVEAGDAPLAGHVLRAMAHQALELGHGPEAARIASASVEGDRYRLASPRERALLGVVHARALAHIGDQRGSAAALLRAEDDLASAGPDREEPGRTFFFGEASLAHETARTLQASGDTGGALREFRRSVRTRNAATFSRTHAVTLGYLGSIQATTGRVEEACVTWNRALDAMAGITSGRTRQTVVDMRRALSPFRRRGIDAVAELNMRAAQFMGHPVA
ncbi:Tat pathway signal protein [Streptomyces sp. CBMA29]|uniref:Tat pathway signal protein n=1 Tax=Streptomyces sp. CBMA29 TaxID=1896314 RepID=UPI001661BF84|nr:Tat pathway signal protein [Streptomyces sp. CBMA29]MBD0737656.1 Tat pathway signal protein [Streptomyces sp. CBMA29]